MNITFTQILLFIIAVAVSIIAIKITFTFDINKYLESKKEDLKNQIMNHCTHMYVNDINGKIGMQSAFISPSGTTQWICKKCSLTLYYVDQIEEQRRMQEMLKNTDNYIKQEKKFQKLLKKGGFI